MIAQVWRLPLVLFSLWVWLFVWLCVVVSAAGGCVAFVVVALFIVVACFWRWVFGLTTRVFLGWWLLCCLFVRFDCGCIVVVVVACAGFV